MKHIGYDPVAERTLFVLAADVADDIPDELLVTGPYFACLLVWDARGVSAGVIGAVAERLLRAGCVYVCCWGPDCERVHDIFDECDLALRPDGPICMTSWHADEPLAEALFFALVCSCPDDAWYDGCRAAVGITVNSPSWACEVSVAFRDRCAAGSGPI